MDQMHSKFKSPSISLHLPTKVGVYGVRERDCPTVIGELLEVFWDENGAKFKSKTVCLVATTQGIVFGKNHHSCNLLSYFPDSPLQ